MMLVRCFTSADTFERVGAVDLGAVCTRETHEGEHLVFGDIHHTGQFGKLLPQLIGHAAPLDAGRFCRFLHKVGVDHGQHRLALPLADMASALRMKCQAAVANCVGADRKLPI